MNATPKTRLKPGTFVLALIGFSVFAFQIEAAATENTEITEWIQAKDLNINDLTSFRNNMQITNLSTGATNVDYGSIQDLSHQADTTELAAITDDGVVAMSTDVEAPYKSAVDFLLANHTTVPDGSDLQRNLNTFLANAVETGQLDDNDKRQASTTGQGENAKAESGRPQAQASTRTASRSSCSPARPATTRTTAPTRRSPTAIR